MKHKIGFNKLNRTPAHRKALLRNMSTVLFKHERIMTTRAKAVELRSEAERMITRAKVDSVHNRRKVAEKITDEAILAKLFKDIAPRMKDRNGGYTRIIRVGMRKHDAADMVIIELVDAKDDGKQAERDKRKAEKKAKAEKAAAEAEKAAEKAQA